MRIMLDVSQKTTRNEMPVMLMALFSLTSSFIGIFNQQLYGASETISNIWFSQNIVTLLLAIPALMYFFHAGYTKHILRARIILLGITGYFIYSGIFYVFSSNYNILYFLNLPLLSVSIYSFVIQFPGLNEQNVQLYIPSKQLMYAVTVYLLFISCLILAFWFSDVWSLLSVNKSVKAGFDVESGITNFSIDIGFIVPIIILGAVRMWQGHHIGHLITGIMLVLGAILGFSLMIRLLSDTPFGLNRFNTFTAVIILNSFAGFVLTFLYFKYLDVIPKRVVKLTASKEVPNKLLFKSQVMNN